MVLRSSINLSDEDKLEVLQRLESSRWAVERRILLPPGLQRFSNAHPAPIALTGRLGSTSPTRGTPPARPITFEPGGHAPGSALRAGRSVALSHSHRPTRRTTAASWLSALP